MRKENEPVINENIFELPPAADGKFGEIPYSREPKAVGFALIDGKYRVYETNERGVPVSDYECDSYEEARIEAIGIFKARVGLANEER